MEWSFHSRRIMGARGSHGTLGRSGFWPIGFFALFLCAITLPFLSGLYPVVRFTEEYIDITVYPDHVRVRGVYVYENPLPFPVIQGMSIPVPIDQDNPAPVLLCADELMPDYRPVPVRHLLGAYRCEITVPAHGTVTMSVEYRQNAPYGKARYLLTTTRPWRRPIKRGAFRLIPRGVEIINSNYGLVPAEEGALFFQREDFIPIQDWEFSWVKKES